jgi:hypothetical protein
MGSKASEGQSTISCWLCSLLKQKMIANKSNGRAERKTEQINQTCNQVQMSKVIKRIKEKNICWD